MVTTHRTVSLGEQLQVDDGGFSYVQDPSLNDQRDPGKVDLAQLLPPGTKLAARTGTVGTTTLRTSDKASASYPVVLIDGTDGLTTGSYRLDDGRLPKAPNEVALSPRTRQASRPADQRQAQARCPGLGPRRPQLSGGRPHQEPCRHQGPYALGTARLGTDQAGHGLRASLRGGPPRRRRSSSPAGETPRPGRGRHPSGQCRRPTTWLRKHLRQQRDRRDGAGGRLRRPRDRPARRYGVRRQRAAPDSHPRPGHGDGRHRRPTSAASSSPRAS